MDNKNQISITTIQRMPNYLRCLKQIQQEGTLYISSVGIADKIGINATVVKKDLSYAIVTTGKPKLGYYVPDLIKDVEKFMGYDNKTSAILVGAGQLGNVLLSYPGFANYGLDIIAAFDVNKDVIGHTINNRKVYNLDDLNEIVDSKSVRMGIITVPKEYAQEVANKMVEAGIKGIWNFAPTNIVVPSNVALKNEDMAASLALLSKQMEKIFNSEI